MKSFLLWVLLPFVVFLFLLGTLKTIQWFTYIHYEKQFQPSDPLPDPPVKLRFLHLNVFWRPLMIHPFKEEYMAERSLLLVDRIGNYDVVCLNEAFQFGSNIVANFVKAADAIGFKYVVSGHTVPILSRKVLDSGVLILSKYPITKTDATVYEQGCSYDAFAAKGAVYARVNIGERNVHVFATHLQASYEIVTTVDFGVRVSQSANLQRLVAECIDGSSPDDTIILLGDMNIDSIGERSEYTTLLQTLTIPGYELIDILKSNGHPVTIAESIEAGEEPEGKHSNHRKSIDYIFLYKQVGAKGANEISAQVQKFPIQEKPYKQLSDHFGLSCTIDFQ
jgi:endonuclease/exonuclease/phosphatase family metal-dependent hydrolase